MEAARVHELDAEAFAGQVRFRKDRPALLEEESLAGAVSRQGECAAVARPVQVEQQAGQGHLVEAALFRDADHRGAHRVIGGET